MPEVAAKLRVTAQTIRNWIDQGTLPALRVGRAFRVHPEDVAELLASATAIGGMRRTRRGVWDPTPTELASAKEPPRSIWDDGAEPVAPIASPR